MGRVEGKIVVVTGAAGGQGAAEAHGLAAEGARVIATDVEVPGLEGGGIVCRALDVTSEEAWGELAEWLHSEYGRVDGLVNNAGISLRLRLAEITIADLASLIVFLISDESSFITGAARSRSTAVDRRPTPAPRRFPTRSRPRPQPSHKQRGEDSAKC